MAVDVMPVIRAALRAPLQSALDPDVVHWEGRLFKPRRETPWYRETMRPASSTVETLGPNGRVRHRGFYQVDVFVPILTQAEGDGTATLDGLMAEVVELYPPNAVMVSGGTTVTVRAEHERRTLPPETAWFRAMLRFGWYADSFNTL